MRPEIEIISDVSSQRLSQMPSPSTTVVPENSVGIEIIELVSIGFSGYVRDVAVITQILLRVFPKSG